MTAKNQPYFLWDYNLNDEQVLAIVHGENEVERQWLIGRILTHARFDDVWKYLTVEDIVSIFPKLRLPARTKSAWANALNIWGYHVQPAR